MPDARIIANRFETRLDVNYGTSFAYRPKTLSISGLGRQRILNNLFLLTDVSAIPSSTTNATGLNAIDTSGGAAGAEIRNNVFDYRSENFDPSGSSDEGVIDLDVSAVVEGNIFVNMTRPNLTFRSAAEADTEFSHNLCFGTSEACGTADGNQDADPIFVDTTNYQLGGGSPGINAGPDVAFLVDLDGSRVDLGLYGGPFPIDQYDAQRDDTSTAPFVFPVFDASVGVDVIGDLPIDVIGVARIR